MAAIDNYLTRKYDILGQQANTARDLANANIGAITQQTSLAPAEARARNFATTAAGTGALAGANLTNVNASLAPGIAGSEAASRYAGADLSYAQAGGIRTGDTLNPFLGQQYQDRLDLNGNPQPGPAQTTHPTWMQQIMGGGVMPNPIAPASSAPPAAPNVIGGAQRSGALGNIQSIPAAPNTGQGNRFQFSTGTSDVHGPGDGTVDTVHADLANGEAVLNRGAAEHLGRDTIALLNSIGAARMGLKTDGRNTPVAADPAGGDPPGYAWGTPDVKPAPAPGQTVTSGTWGSPTPNADIRNSVGRPGVPRVVGKPQAMNEEEDVPGYAKGTANVQKGDKGTKGKGRALPAKGGVAPPQGGMSPEIMQALLQMGSQGGGGMPPPGGQPMPMSMPAVARR
jgi:hypothetical protein